MEVIPSTATGSGSIPLHQHNVEEWSRLDSLTGMLEHARVETGHWTANTSTSSQQYGKVIDSRARNLADGSMQQRQRKQLEVFQAQVPGGSLQVIRTQSVTSTSSSSSSWRTPLHSDANVASDFENIQLSVKPLDLSTQKTKASVGRSGSIGSRRPPSRPRSIISKVDTAISEKNLLSHAEKEDVDQRLSEVSRICQEIHEESKNNVSNSLLFPLPQSAFSLPAVSDNTMIKADNINRRDFIDVNKYSYTKSDKQNSLSILDTFSDRAKKADQTVSSGRVHAIITRNKSCSIEDLQNNNHGEKDGLSEGTDMSTDLARTSVIRRSLQLPNRENRLYISNGNVSKFCQELQDGETMDAIKNNDTGFDALENKFRYDSGSERNTSLLFKKNNQACSLSSVTDKSGNGYELSESGIFDSAKVSSYKRHSFVTVESLKEVRGRLRHLSAPSPDGIQHPDSTKCQTRHVEDSDDGIVIEDFSKSIPGTNSGLAEQVPSSRVKLYMYGKEAMPNCQNNMNKSAGTGSLESRTCNRSGSSGGSRSEEWYTRRKSYGFEQVHNQQTDNHSEPVTFQEKTRVESSTDSGIYRSSETVTTSSWAPFNREKANGQSTYGNLKANQNIKIKQHSNDRIITETENRGTEINSQIGGRTIVTFGSDNEGNKRELHVNGGNMMETSSMTVSNNWVSGCDNRATNTMTSNTSVKSFRRFSEPVTVTIPIVHDDSFNNINGNGIIDAKKCYLNQFSEGSSLSIEDEWRKSGTSLTSGKDSAQKNLVDVSKPLAARRELFQKHSGENDLSPAFRQTDNQVKRHSIAVDESKYVREGLKNYNLWDKRIGHINSENMFKITSTSIPDLENCSGLNLYNNKFAVPLHKELECKIPTATGISQDGSDFKPASFTFENGDDDELFLQNHLAGKKHKKVEFCKTEVHFAAEPGRFNIVETDEKPPPNNIRRRRRSSISNNNSSYAILCTPQVQDAGKTNLPEIRFGDSPYEMKLLGGTESNNTPYQIDVSANTCNKSDLNHSMHIKPASSFPTEFQDDASNIFTQENATMLSSGRQDTVEIEVHSNEKDVCSDSVVLQPNPMTSTSPRPRSILKNSKNPRFFHLGETDGVLISALSEKSETLSGDHETKWGVRLKPIHNRHLPLSSTSTWKSTVTLHNPKLDDQKQQNYSPSLTLKNGKLQFPHSYAEGAGLSTPPKSFQPSFQRKFADDFVAPVLANTQSPESGVGGMDVKIFMAPSWSVAERVRQVEDLERASLEARGYSTKVNLVSGKTTVIDSRSSDEQQSVPVLPKYQQKSHQKSVCLHIDEQKEEAMHVCDHADGSSMLKLDNSKESSLQKRVTEDNLQSYSSDLHPKDKLITTHSVHPKITSVSLQHKEESIKLPPRVCDTNSDCDRYRTSFHISPSPKKGNLHVNEFEYPTDFEVNASSTTTSSKSCNKSLFTPQNSNADSSKSLFTQKHKGLLPTFVKSTFEPERQAIHFTHDERNYGNLNPRTQKRGNNCLGTDHTMSFLGKKVLHPETEDKFVLYHNHNKHDYFPKYSSKQESDPMVSSNNMSLSSVLNKTTNKDQEKKQFRASVPTQCTASLSSNTSDLVSGRKNSIEDIKMEKIKVRGEEIKKDGRFHVKTLSNEKHKHLDGTFNHESYEDTEISDHYHERMTRTNTLKSIKSVSTKHDSSVSLGGRVHSGREVTMSPVYENMKMLLVEPTTKSSGQNLLTNAGETESDILEELTQAADQILQAVVGYTDEESCRASSDEPDDEIVQDGRRRRGKRCGKVQKPLVSLGTITEAPSSKKQQETRNRTSELRSHKSIGSTRKSQQITKTRPQPTSSTSSLESFTKEISQVQKRALLKQEGSSSVDNCNKRKVESSSASSVPIKSGSRTARLFQRASSREHLLQTCTSSSEDVASGVKGDNNRKPLVPRCTRSHNSSNNKSDPTKSSLKKSTVSPDYQPTLSAKVRARKRDPDSNKPKERLPGTSNRIVPLVRKSSGGDSVKPSGGKLHTFRSKEDRHQRDSSRLTVKRENRDLGHRAQGTGATTMEPSVHDKSKRTVIHERRVMGSVGGIGLSSASCVVPHVYPISASSVNHHDNSRTKKKMGLASSQNEELVHRKTAK